MQILRNGRPMRIAGVRLARPSDDGRAEHAGDNNQGSEWRYERDVARLRSAVFTLADPIIDPAGASFDIVMNFRRGDGYQLGHFRLQAAPAPGSDQPAVVRYSADTAEDRQRTRQSLASQTFAADRALDDLVSKVGKYQSLIAKLDKQTNDKQRDKVADDLAEARVNLLDVTWPAVVDQFQAAATLESARPDADSRYVADLGLASRGVDHLKRAYLAVATPADQLALEMTDSLRDSIARPLAALAAVHDLAETAQAVTRLTARERWQSHTPWTA
jgi:hypothetical protein